MSRIIPIERIENKIYLIRSQKVILDKDIAELYGVETKALNQAVNRNIDRFPDDFMFQLTQKEFAILKSQFVTSSWGGTRKLPRAFTEQGIAMLSSVLRSKKAAHVNIAIMRAFIKLKTALATHKDVSRKLKELEDKYQKHDKEIQTIFVAIRQMIAPETKPKQRIGFIPDS